MAVRPEKTVRVDVAEEFGDRPWDLDGAVKLQKSRLVPAVHSGYAVVFDFAGVEMVTHSFVHALVSRLKDELGGEFNAFVSFENMDPFTKSVVKLSTEWG